MIAVGEAVTNALQHVAPPVRLRRAIVVMMSGRGQPVRDITSLLQVTEESLDRPCPRPRW